MTSLPGIDVSAIGQGATFNWEAWRGKIAFGFAKATEGTNFQDPDYDRNRQGARSIGVRFGAYHVIHGGQDGAEQARYFLNYAKPVPGDLVMIDFEPSTTDSRTAPQMSAIGGACADQLRAELGAWPFVYSDLTMIVSGYLSSLGPCPLWLANPSRIPTPNGVGPWRVVSMEQVGQRGVDTDTFYGDGEQLAKLSVAHAPGAPAPAPTPAPPPPLHSWRLIFTSSNVPGFIAIESTDGGKTWR